MSWTPEAREPELAGALPGKHRALLLGKLQGDQSPRRESGV